MMIESIVNLGSGLADELATILTIFTGGSLGSITALLARWSHHSGLSRLTVATRLTGLAVGATHATGSWHE